MNKQEPFLDATRDILGQDSCYQMIAYTTMQLSESFRNLCRTIMKYSEEEDMEIDPSKEGQEKKIQDKETAKDMLTKLSETLEVPRDKLKKIDYKTFNDISKELTKDNTAYDNDKFWGKLVAKSREFIGSIVSTSPSPASFLLLNEDIKSEYGIIKKGEALCVPITSMEVEDWKFLKNDYLVVTVVDLIDKVFKEINQTYMTPNELIGKLTPEVFDIYAKGLTTTINQVDTDFARNLVMKYQPKSYEELSAFVAGIRPGFKSLLENFIERRHYTTGNKQLDKVLEDTNHYLIYQESIMKYLTWLGVEEDKTYGIIKKISKKTLTEEELNKLHKRLEKNWENKTGTIEGFQSTWQTVEDASRYSFNSAHAVAYAFDSLYGAYLKTNYPLEYYTIALNTFLNDSDTVTALIEELSHFGIELSPPKFENPSSEYSYDKETKTIYQGIGSIKYIGKALGNKLKKISNNKYETFIDVLYDLKSVGADMREIEILIKIGFFSKQFPSINQNLAQFELFKKFNDRKSFNKKDLEPWSENIVKNLEGVSELKTRYSIENMYLALEILAKSVPYTEETIQEKIRYQYETMGFVLVKDQTMDRRFVLVQNLNKKYSPTFNAYCLNNGKSVRLKIYKQSNKQGKGFVQYPFEDGDILYINKFEKKAKMGYVDGRWQAVEPAEYEWWATDYDVV